VCSAEWLISFRSPSPLPDSFHFIAAFDAVICTAGAWEGGSIISEKLGESLDRMIKANLNPSVLAGRMATQRIRDGGCLVFTIAGAAVMPFPGMISYGLAKNAVAQDKRYRIVGLLPDTLDTPANRKAMPNVPTDRWVPPEEIAARLFWIIDTGKYRGYRNPVFFGFETRNKETSMFDASTRAVNRSPLDD
jgi:NAD(P)-dependent dehydrogenase (short-subunit alcohol dehydrogenase family)